MEIIYMFVKKSMHGKPLLTLAFIFLVNMPGFCQEPESVLRSPDGWKSEIIPFPLSFAPEIDYTGFEDIRFAPGWSDSTSVQFWAYCFVWYIDQGPAITEETLTRAFNQYYDGLMSAVSNNRTGESPDQKTICLFIKTDEGFYGKMRVYDAFFTRDYMSLQIKVTESNCPDRGKHIVRCNISPQAFDDELWDIFDQVKVVTPCK